MIACIRIFSDFVWWVVYLVGAWDCCFAGGFDDCLLLFYFIIMSLDLVVLNFGVGGFSIRLVCGLVVF